MNKQILDQFKARAHDVQLPESVRRSILTETAGEKDPSPRRRGITRRAAVGVGLGALGTAAALLALSVVAKPEDEPGNGTGGSWFALRAYAEGVSQGSDTVLTSAIHPANSLGGSPESGWYVARSIDLACTGANISNVTYALEGDCLSPSGQPGEPFTEPLAWLDALYSNRDELSPGDEVPDNGGSPLGFTVPYDELAADERSFNRQIWTCFPTDERVDAAWKRAESDGAAEEDYLRYLVLLERRSADILARITFSLTATFTDGSTLTKRYGIAPRDDFDEACLAFYSDFDATSTPELFVITELEP